MRDWRIALFPDFDYPFWWVAAAWLDTEYPFCLDYRSCFDWRNLLMFSYLFLPTLSFFSCSSFACDLEELALSLCDVDTTFKSNELYGNACTAKKLNFNQSSLSSSMSFLHTSSLSFSIYAWSELMRVTIRRIFSSYRLIYRMTGICVSATRITPMIATIAMIVNLEMRLSTVSMTVVMRNYAKLNKFVLNWK